MLQVWRDFLLFLQNLEGVADIVLWLGCDRLAKPVHEVAALTQRKLKDVWMAR
jgi:hypothetical protein